MSNADPNVVAADDSSVGWYGKLPSAGDFLSRRLPGTFIHEWDRWLQQGLAHSREQLGERWLDLYMTFPVWRFLVPAGGVGPSAWCGILLPSVDRVGRCFPLTICRALTPSGVRSSGLISIDLELEQFAQAGLLGLDGEPVEQFDRVVEAIEPATPVWSGESPVLEDFANEFSSGCWPLDAPLQSALAHAAERLVLASLGHRSLWWTPAADGVAGTMRLESLPLPPEFFTALIAHQ